MKFFWQKNIDINSVSFPNFGWEAETSNQAKKLWINPEGSMGLSINFFKKTPDIPVWDDINALRQFYRNQLIQPNGGVIEIEQKSKNGLEYVKTIFKIPQQPNGMNYIAAITIPFAKFSFVIKIQAMEVGITGMREAILTEKLIREGVISLEGEEIKGWVLDPYNPEYKEGAVMNLSENEMYDAEFPEHPLSQARKVLNQIETEMTFTPELLKLKKFGG